MNNQLQKICDCADIVELKKIPPMALPIKQMIIYLENKKEEYEHILTLEVSSDIHFLKIRTIECLSYLKKVQ